MFKKYLSILLLVSLIFFCKGIFFAFSHAGGHDRAIVQDNQANQGSFQEMSCCSQDQTSSDDLVFSHHKFFAFLTKTAVKLPVVFVVILYSFLAAFFLCNHIGSFLLTRPPPQIWMQEQFSKGILHPKTW